MSDDSRPTTLSDSTRVPLRWLVAAIITVAGSAVSGTYLVVSQLNGIKGAIERIEYRSMDRWSGNNMDRWIDKASLRNPTLVLPSVKEIRGDER